MSIVDFPIRGEACSVLQARDASALSGIKQPGVAAAIWQREPAPEFVNWISGLPPDKLPKLRSLVGADALEGCIQAACSLAGTPAGPERDMLAGDIAALGYLMSEIMETPLLHVRLEAVSTNACRRFHVDNMTARMLCTYRGAGTQLTQPGTEAAPLSVSQGSAVLLRGRCWPGEEQTVLLHRSPPIEGTGETRLLAVIDPAFDYKPEGRLH
ncbi:DUF1826 domain-containing protein [Leisingera sp. ANG-Vp]|uniref:DUF1826 domain-containing protein n=1 Tax=Leisingera sp. ANG-Vp TaxID=1577896 RepID=UPI00126A36CE|nr:DUF1826 domain-containing protein [Leisingera sp. ANG-Vp]